MKLSFRIKQDIDVAFDYLTDMQKFVSIHPVISQIDPIEHEHYLVHETLRFGLIPFSFTYPISIKTNRAEKAVLIHATVFKVTKIEIKFLLTRDQAFTVIDEEVHFKSPLPVKFIMEHIFKKQHTLLFKNMEQQ